MAIEIVLQLPFSHFSDCFISVLVFTTKAFQHSRSFFSFTKYSIIITVLLLLLLLIFAISGKDVRRLSGRQDIGCSFYYYSISIIVPKTDVQSGLVIFCAPTSPVGQLARLLFFLQGRSRSAAKNGYKQRGIDISISQHFSKKPKLTNGIRKSLGCHLNGFSDFELSSVSG